MSRTILQDVDRVLISAAHQEWAAKHTVDQNKIMLERDGKRRPTAGDPYARVVIEAIRVGIANELPEPPLPSIQELGRNVMFTAQNPEVALRCPAHWRVALSADPKFDSAVRVAAPKIKQNGNLMSVWGVQTQVGVARIKQLGAELGADFLIFQAETPDEYDTAIAAGATLIVGNPNNWTDAQRDDAIARGDTLTTLFEVYSNEGSPFPDTASSRNVPVSCEVLGVGWGANPYQLKDYRPRTPDGVWSTISVYAAEYMNEESWALLP